MATPRKTPPTPPAVAESPASDDSLLDSALGSYAGDDAMLLKLAPEKFYALMTLGLDEDYNLPDTMEETSRFVDGWVDWLLTTYPTLADEIEQLRETESQLNTDNNRLAGQLRDRKQQAKTLLKLLVRAETRDDLRLRELLEQIIGGVQRVVGLHLPDEVVQILLSHPDIAVHLNRTANPNPEQDLEAPAAAVVPAEATPEPEIAEPAAEEVAAAEPQSAESEPVHLEIAADAAPQAEEVAPTQPAGLPEVSRTAAQLHTAWVATQKLEHNDLRSSTGESLFVAFEQLSGKTQHAYEAQVQSVYAAIRAVEAADAANQATQETPADVVDSAPESEPENAPEAAESADEGQ